MIQCGPTKGKETPAGIGKLKELFPLNTKLGAAGVSTN